MRLCRGMQSIERSVARISVHAGFIPDCRFRNIRTYNIYIYIYIYMYVYMSKFKCGHEVSNLNSFGVCACMSFCMYACRCTHASLDTIRYFMLFEASKLSSWCGKWQGHHTESICIHMHARVYVCIYVCMYVCIYSCVSELYLQPMYGVVIHVHVARQT